MASLTRSDARTLARYIAQDDGTNPAVSDAEVNTYLEEARQWYGSTFPDDVVAQAGSLGAPLTDEMTLSTSSAVFRTIDFAYNATTGAALEKSEYPLLYANNTAQYLADSTYGDPTSFAVYRLSDTTWKVAFYPKQDPANGVQVTLFGHSELEPMSADGDALRFGNHGSRVIARLAALEMARAAGRPDDFLADIAAQLPERVATRRQDIARLLGPKPMRT